VRQVQRPVNFDTKDVVVRLSNGPTVRERSPCVQGISGQHKGRVEQTVMYSMEISEFRINPSIDCSAREHTATIRLAPADL
jgi:hypothetical protein